MSTILTILALALFTPWAIHGIIEWRKDSRWRKNTGAKFDDNWRQVPPPNWASRRGTHEYW
jgi:hypothetical protein